MLRVHVRELSLIAIFVGACAAPSETSGTGADSAEEDSDAAGSESEAGDASSGSAESSGSGGEENEASSSGASESGDATSSSSTTSDSSSSEETTAAEASEASTSSSSSSTSESGEDTSGADSGDQDAFLIQDFEDAAAGSPPDAATWTIFTDGGEVTVSDADAHGGSNSVLVSTQTAGSYAYFTTATEFPPPGGVIYFRFWMKFAAGGWENHVTFLSSGTDATPGSADEVRLGGQANTYHSNLGADGDGLSPNPWEECSNCVTPVPNEWHCISGFFDGASDHVYATVNGDLFVDASSMDDWHSGTGNLPDNLSRLSFGWHAHGGGPANAVYFDDLALSHDGELACE